MYSDPKMAMGLAFGILVLLYAIGTAYVRWVNPRSGAESMFRARWRFGGRVSDAGVAAQIVVMTSLGLTLLLGAFNSSLTPIFFWAFLAALVLSLLVWLLDQRQH